MALGYLQSLAIAAILIAIDRLDFRALCFEIALLCNCSASVLLSECLALRSFYIASQSNRFAIALFPHDSRWAVALRSL
jgi:hypothetical protein